MDGGLVVGLLILAGSVMGLLLVLVGLFDERR